MCVSTETIKHISDEDTFKCNN